MEQDRHVTRGDAERGGDVLAVDLVQHPQCHHGPLHLAERGDAAAQPDLILGRRQQLLDGAWGPDWFGDERTVDVHVRQLRKKLGDDLPLATVWGVGYRLG